MRRRVLSVVLAVMAVLAFAGIASAQIVRTDTIIGFAQTQAVPAVAEGTFVPRVQPTDTISASMGEPIASYVTDLDAWFAVNFGFRPSTPVTFLLFSNGEDTATAATNLAGGAVDRNLVLSRPSFLVQATQPASGIQTGEWAILVNLDMDAAAQTFTDLLTNFHAQVGFAPPPAIATPEQAMLLVQQSMARDYATLMEMQLTGNAGPIFYREGLADAISFRIVPGSPEEFGRALSVAEFQLTGNPLPTLSSLEQTWETIISPGGQIFDVSRGIAFLSVNTVFNQAGGPAALNVLQQTAAGQDFNTALQSITGFSLDQLNLSYQSLIPTL